MLLVLKLPNQCYINLRTLRMMPLFSRMSHELVLLRAFGPLHVVWQVSFGCWIKWSISSWQNFYKSAFFPKSWVMGSKTSFSVSQQLRPEPSAKWILSILSDLPLTRESAQKKLSNFARLQLLNHKIDQKKQFCPMALFVSVSLVRGKSERIESKFK